MKTITNARFHYIDSMRAIAALLVVWLHTSETFVKIAKPSSQDSLFQVADFFDFGRIGVVIFFAISGFVIPSSLSIEKPTGARDFIIKRFFRMYPLYWLSIPFGLLTSWYIWDKPLSAEAIIWNFTMVQEAAGFPSIQGLYWTLQTELVFYGICLALYLCGCLKSIWMLGSLACIFTLAHLGPLILSLFGVHVSTPLSPSAATMSLNLGVMCWGAIFRVAFDEAKGDGFSKVIVFGYLAAWCIFLIYAIKTLSVNAAYFKLLAPYALGVLMFTFFALRKRVTARWLVWLGTISYSIYLFHPVVMYSIARLVQVSDLNWIKGWTTGAYILLTLVLTIIVSAITHRYVEVQGIRLGNEIIKGRSGRQSFDS